MNRQLFVIIIGAITLMAGCANTSKRTAAADNRQGDSAATQVEELNVKDWPDTLGISLIAEYSVYPATADTATFLLLNAGGETLTCGEESRVAYEAEEGKWYMLRNDYAFNCIGYEVRPGGHRRVKAWLRPDLNNNKAGRYRVYYDVRIRNAKAMTLTADFRLTDGERELEKAVRRTVPEQLPIRHTEALTPKDDGYAWEVVEEMPQFPGGTEELRAFLDRNIRHPEGSGHAEGRVIVKFIVMEDGRVAHPQVIRGLLPEYDKEALRVVSSMPRWIPGKQNGQPVKVWFTVAIAFRKHTKYAERYPNSIR